MSLSWHINRSDARLHSTSLLQPSQAPKNQRSNTPKQTLWAVILAASVRYCQCLLCTTSYHWRDLSCYGLRIDCSLEAGSLSLIHSGPALPDILAPVCQQKSLTLGATSTITYLDFLAEGYQKCSPVDPTDQNRSGRSHLFPKGLREKVTSPKACPTSTSKMLSPWFTLAAMRCNNTKAHTVVVGRELGFWPLLVTLP